MSSDNHTPIQHIVDDHNKKKEQSIQHTPGSKEGVPMPAKSSEVLTMPEESFEQESVPESEAAVEDFIEEQQEEIDIPPDLKQIGVQHPAHSTSHIPMQYQNVKLPISDDKVIQGLQQPIDSSMRWLAEFAMYILRHAHLGLKVVHGKVVRVIKK